MPQAEYAELHCHSQHSLRDGAAHIEDLVARAKARAMPALAITDHDSMAVAPEFRAAALSEGVKPIQGAEVSFAGHGGGAFHLTLLAENDAGFAHLCELLTLSRPPERRQDPLAAVGMLEGRTEGMICLTGCAKGELAYHLLRHDEEAAKNTLARWVALFGRGGVFVELQDHALGFEASLNRRRCELAEFFGLPVVATNNVHTLSREDFWVHEALACWRAGRVSRSAVFPDRPRSAECYLKGADEMSALFRERPEALQNTLAIAERCAPVLDPSIRRWPDFQPPPGHTEQTYLAHLTGIGLRARYGPNPPNKALRRLQYELRLIHAKGFDGYFLQVWDICRWMRKQDILYRIRGSAGGSLAAYALFIGTLDPFVYNLSFDRFMNEARSSPPDIDLDIDHRERDRVVARLREVYGADRVASVAAYSTIRGKSLLRDFGPVFDLPPDAVDLASKSLRNVRAHQLENAFDNLPQLRDTGLPKEPFRPLMDLGLKISRFPSHNQTMVGVVVSGKPLTEVSPLWPAAKDNAWAVAYDKEWVEKTGLIKTDFLFLRELAAIRDCLKSMAESGVHLDYEKIPFDDPETFQLLQSGETIGTFQLESPAQRVLMQRLRPKDITDCVAAVALVRPGPIQGDAITPFVNRRNGREPVTYPDPRLEPALKETLGVVIYQDQVIELAMAAAGWGPDRADTLRRRISHARSQEQMREIGEEFTASVIANGFTEDVAAWCFKSILGFASYGFCAAHAAAFGETAYRSAYLLAHHPSHYLMGVMNNFPMAYYPLRTIVAEARRRGVKVLGPDINRSGADDRANDTTIRAGLKHVRGIAQKTLAAIESARRDGPFHDIFAFCRRVPISHSEVESLALSGAFDSVHPNRKAILRAAARLSAGGAGERGGGLLVADRTLPAVPDFPPYERALRELATLGFCVGKDPVAFHRARLESAGIRTCRDALHREGQMVYIAGWRTRPHTPPIRSGKTIIFFTVEDETAVVDVTVFPDAYDVYGRVIFAESLVVVRGRMESRDGALGLIAESVRPLNEVVQQVRQLEQMLPPMEGVSHAEAGWTMPLEAHMPA